MTRTWKEKTTVLKGLYQVEGDSLKLAFADKENDPRPASFDKATKVVIFKRQKP
jgi:uncharacterized protein (TIGR03067 family)